MRAREKSWLSTPISNLNLTKTALNGWFAKKYRVTKEITTIVLLDQFRRFSLLASHAEISMLTC